MDLVRSHRERTAVAVWLGTTFSSAAAAFGAPSAPARPDGLSAIVPAALHDVHFLAVPLWQWLGLSADAAAAVVVGLLVGVIAARLLRPIAERLHTSLARRIGQMLLGPTRLVSAVAAFYV